MNFKRIITSVVLIAIVILTFVLRRIDTRFFSAFIYLCSIFGTFEMIRAFGNRLTIFQKVLIFAYSLIITPLYVFIPNIELTVLATFIAFVLILLSIVFGFEITKLESVGYSIVAIFYPTLVLFPMLIMNGKGDLSFPCLMLIFIVAPCSDMLAYVVGNIFKGKKMAEKISPKKTVSGGIGGVVGGTLGALIFGLIFAKNNLIFSYYWQDIIFYVLIGVFGGLITEIGDLIEGAIKRKVGIKDMGTILPGHGGVLDRIDGIMLTSLFVSAVFMFVM